jgi:hypothetical protein
MLEQEQFWQPRLTLGIFCKIEEVANIFGAIFSTVQVIYLFLCTKNGLGSI